MTALRHLREQLHRLGEDAKRYGNAANPAVSQFHRGERHAYERALTLLDAMGDPLAEIREKVLALPAITVKPQGGYGPRAEWASPGCGYVLCDAVLALLKPEKRLPYVGERIGVEGAGTVVATTSETVTVRYSLAEIAQARA